MNSPMRNAIALTMAGLLSSSSAWAVDLADMPLFLTTPLAPNIIVTLDTSGSMDAAHTPDNLDSNGGDDTKRYKSSYYNPMYYNPEVVYPQPRKYDGTLADTSFNKAWINGFDPSKGYGDLATQYKPTSNYTLSKSGNTYDSGQSFAGGTNPFAVAGSPTAYTYSNCNVNFNSRSGGDRIEINSGCPDAFANITVGTVLTVTGATRAGTYTVTDVDAANNRVEVGNPWSNDADNKVATLSWTAPGPATNPAYYYRFYSESGAAKPSGCNDTKTDDDCYLPAQVTASSGPGTKDLNDDGVIDAADKDELQNFANWYSFYRVRTLAMITSANVSFWTLAPEARLAWQNLTTCNTFKGDACVGRSGTNYPNYIKEFSGTHRDNFFKWMFDMKIGGYTPLRSATQRAGEYVKNGLGGTNDPFAEFPQVDTGTVYSCRKNFHILMTDGVWNTQAETETITVGNVDGDYGKPYYDNRSASLADLMYHYWKEDLRPDLADNVPQNYVVDASETVTDGSTSVVLSRDDNPKNNPANWQHMTNFTMGLGLTSTLTDPVWAGSTYEGGYPRIVTGADTWTDSASDDTRKIYDLWHGAINSRGEFFSTEDPAAMTLAFKAILSAIDEDVSSASGLSTNSTSIRTDSVLFQARFAPREWSGELLAYSITSDGKLGNVNWDAGTKMATRNPEKIATWVPGEKGKVFKWDNLSVDQKAQLNKDITGATDTKGADRLAWLKGDTTQEVRFGGSFRDRKTTVLGDIVNADLVYTRNEDFGYGSAAFTAKASEGASYDAFVSGKSSRPGMVYAGANDGMLHGFTADKVTGGNEMLAYVPHAVYEKLSALTDPGYTHQYYVDGPAVVADANIGGNWKTVLVSGLGKGGKALFALDVSDPANFDPEKHVLWEKSSADSGYENLGFVYGKPKVVRISSGWVAILGNGYNSQNGKASLLVVNIADGSVLQEIVVDAGPDNGLSEPSLVDTDGDRIMDYAYAGDLQGNMWKFNLETFTSPYKLFAAGAKQPITVAPIWGPSPVASEGGVMLYFGTGQYLGASDLNVDPADPAQSFYGIWDKGATVSRTELQVQEIVGQETHPSAREIRETTDNDVALTGADAKLGWYMDLGGGTGNTGERVVKSARLSLGWLMFSTVIPTENRCDAGGDSWFFILDPKTGKRPGNTALDVNKDGKFDSADTLSDGKTPPSAARSEIGILSAPLVIVHDTTASWDPLYDMVGGSGEIAGTSTEATGTSFTSGSTGKIAGEGILCNGCTPPAPPSSPPLGVNRIYWRQIQ